MDPNMFPTKGNLIRAKNSYALAKQGYELMELIVRAEDIQSKIMEVYTDAYRSLQQANIELGISNVENFADAVSTKDNI